MMDRDDFIDGLWLQGSSQWDGLTHIRHPEFGNYNGVSDSQIHGGPGTKLGVDQWAERCIVGRGVLVDMKRHYESTGQQYDVTSAHQITPDDLRAALERQGVELLGGDVLLVHTGWMQHFLDGDAATRAEMLDPMKQTAPGLQVDDATVRFLWDHRVAAVASDTVGVEAAGPDLRFALHPKLLCLLGIPLGEYWALDALATDCADDGRYEFLLVSVPLNLRGGVGTPPQAVAIK
jgi:kynurenine formamidase